MNNINYNTEMENLINRIEGVKESFIFGKQKQDDKDDIKINAKIVFDREIVKKIKALRFVEYYLKKGDLYNSYFNMKYLKDYDTEISKLRVMINSKIKNDSFIELYEHHIL